jgi:hypothetical protein
MIFDELNKYKDNGHFFFNPAVDLMSVCNAPADKAGVYIIYALKSGKIELVYIGSSGEITSDGKLPISTSGIGRLKDELVNGKQFGEPRRSSWKTIMNYENIEALDIYWYATHGDKYVDSPRIIEEKLIQRHREIYGQFPKWNNESFTKS